MRRERESIGRMMDDNDKEEREGACGWYKISSMDMELYGTLQLSSTVRAQRCRVRNAGQAVSENAGKVSLYITPDTSRCSIEENMSRDGSVALKMLNDSRLIGQ